MKKRILSAILIGLTVLLLGGTASADVLWEPNNNFYEVHREDCKPLGRDFIANGADGKVVVWQKPGSLIKADTQPNGSQFFVSFTYEDPSGNVWGVVQYQTDTDGAITEEPGYEKALSGWIVMSDLLVVYDYISFDEDHRSEFHPYTGDYGALMELRQLVLYKYPGSSDVLTTATWLMSDTSFPYAYTDKDGREWVFISYNFGFRNCWLCVSDPTNQALPVVETTPAPLYNPQPGSSTAVSPNLLLIIALVAAVVAVTAALIRIFWKKK